MSDSQTTDQLLLIDAIDLCLKICDRQRSGRARHHLNLEELKFIETTLRKTRQHVHAAPFVEIITKARPGLRTAEMR